MKLTIATAVLFLSLPGAAFAQTNEAGPPPPGGPHDNMGHHGGPPMSEACKSAIEQTCPGVKPGEGRIRECLKAHNTSFKQLCPNDKPPGGGQHAGGPPQGGSASSAPGRAPVAQAPAGQ